MSARCASFLLDVGSGSVMRGLVRIFGVAVLCVATGLGVWLALQPGIGDGECTVVSSSMKCEMTSPDENVTKFAKANITINGKTTGCSQLTLLHQCGNGPNGCAGSSTCPSLIGEQLMQGEPLENCVLEDDGSCTEPSNILFMVLGVTTTVLAGTTLIAIMACQGRGGRDHQRVQHRVHCEPEVAYPYLVSGNAEAAFTYPGLDLKALDQNPTLKDQFVSAIKEGVVSVLQYKFKEGVLFSDDINVVLSSGSIVAKVTITPKAGMSVMDIIQKMTENEEAVTAAVSSRSTQVPNLASVCEAGMTLQDVIVSVNKAAETMTASDEAMSDEVMISKIFKACDADKDEELSMDEHYTFAKASGFVGDANAFSTLHGTMLKKAESSRLDQQAFARIIAGSEPFRPFRGLMVHRGLGGTEFALDFRLRLAQILQTLEAGVPSQTWSAVEEVPQAAETLRMTASDEDSPDHSVGEP